MTWLQITVDIGNTSVCMQAYRRSQAGPEAIALPVRFFWDDAQWLQQVAQWYAKVLKKNRQPESIAWAVASVHPPVCKALHKQVVQNTQGADSPPLIWNEVTWQDLPLQIELPRPDLVGIDRLVAGWAAWSRYSGAIGESAKGSIVVIDAGSAITVDLIDAPGAFRGGAIIPGWRSQVDALAKNAFGLKDLGIKQTSDKMVPSPDDSLLLSPGHDTIEAVKLGVAASTVGAVQYLVSLYASQSPSLETIVLTGGDTSVFLNQFQQKTHLAPDLVLQGLSGLELKN